MRTSCRRRASKQRAARRRHRLQRRRRVSRPRRTAWRGRRRRRASRRRPSRIAQAYAEAHAQAAHLAAKARKHAAAHAQAAAHASHLQKVAALGAPSVHVQHSRTRVGVQGFGQPHASSGMHTCACHETPSCIMERSTNMLRVWGARVPSAYLANYSRCGMQRMAQRRQ